jgi:2-hydroxychromene-2-carboxylate isomerase
VPPTLYFDLQSPYAYLAVARAADVLGEAPVLEPVLLGAIFAKRGSGSWSGTGSAAANIAEVERRAAAYGLPPVTWPPGWPVNSVAPARAATWAKLQGATAPYAHAAYRRAFAEGGDLSDVDVLAAVADEVGLDGAALRAGIADQAVKDALRADTEAAWAAGVVGVPCLRVGDEVLYGDDRLEEAVGLRRAE